MRDLAVEKDDVDFLLKEMVTAQTNGLVWTAYDHSPGSGINRHALHFFATQADAENFCAESSTALPEPDEERYGVRDFRYVPLSQMLLYVMGQPETYLGLDIADWELSKQMARQDLFPLFNDTAGMLEHFQNGRVCPVVWLKKTNVSLALSSFHIVQNRPVSQPWNHGGVTSAILNSFENFGDGKSAMDFIADQSSQLKDDLNYLLVGQYRGQKLELDVDGRPESHTGLILSTAYWQYDIGLAVKCWQVREDRDWNEPALIQKYFLAAYDREQQTIRVLNGKLEPVIPATAAPLLYPRFYNNNLLTTKNQKIMTQESFEFTRDQLKNLGFGEEIAEKLHTAMDQNLAEFKLEHSREFGKDVVNSVLHFSKGDEKDYTFFNRFDATLKQEGKEDLTQTFFIGPKYNYTLQERYNMMDTRYAFREQPKMEPKEGENGETKMKPTGETYKAWRGLDFKQADKYGNFLPKVIFWDHEKELQKYPIKNIEEKYDRSRLMRPLEKGNKVNITLLRDGVETPAQMVANPRMMRLDFYNTDGQSLIVRRVEKQAVDQTQKVEQTPQQIQQAAIAREAARQQEKNDQAQNRQPGEGENQPVAQAQDQQENAKNKVAEEQQNNQANRRRQGVRV